MTTKVDISCPDNSRWRETQSHVIAPGGRLDGLYLTSSRRVLLEEIARDA